MGGSAMPLADIRSSPIKGDRCNWISRRERNDNRSMNKSRRCASGHGVSSCVSVNNADYSDD